MSLRKPLTRAQWDEIAEASIATALRQNRNMTAGQAIRKVNEKMAEVYGPRPLDPEKPPKPPWWARIGLWFVRRKLEKLEVPMFLKKLVVSLGSAAAAGLSAYSVATSGGVTQDEWGGVIGAALVAGYAAFKSNTTWLAPSRKGESITKFGPKQ